MRKVKILNKNRIVFIFLIYLQFLAPLIFAAEKVDINISSLNIDKPPMPVNPKIIQIPERPNPPALNPVTTPTKENAQTLSGTKDKGTSVWLNGQLIIESNPDTNWSYPLILAEGNNPISLTCKNKWNEESDPVLSNIILDTQMPSLAIASPKDREWFGRE